LHTKSQAHTVFLKFKLFSETQTHCKLLSEQTNYAKEFNALTNYFQENDIKYRLTYSYRHEQNEAIERKHRHIT